MADFRNIFRGLPGFCLLLDPDLTILDGNEAFLSFMQVSRKIFQKKSILDVFLDYPGKKNKELTWKKFFKKIQNTKSIQKMLPTNYLVNNVVNNEIRKYFFRPMGIPILKNNKLTNILLILLDSDSQDSDLFFQLKNIKKENELLYIINRKLIKSGAQRFHLTSIVESTEDAIIINLPDGTIQTWNSSAEYLYGYKKEEIIGKNIQVLFPKHLMHEFFNIMDKIKQGNSVHYLETERKHKNKSIISVSALISPIKSIHNKTIGICSIEKDITEMKENQHLKFKNKELEELNALKSQFVANVSHELRTPLHCILGFAKLITHEKVGVLTSVQKEYVNEITKSAHQLTNSINDILDLAKIESGKMNFQMDIVNFVALVDAIKKNFKILLGNKKMKFSVKLDKNLKNVISDREKLRQIIINYLSNAIKFTPAGGEISLSIFCSDNDYFCIRVKDTGIGVSKKNLGKLFVRFHQLDNSNQKQYQGSGLGLAIVYELVNAMKGKVGVESEFGKGSQFYVMLPLLKHI